MLGRVLEHVYTHVCVPALGRIGLKVISLQPWLELQIRRQSSALRSSPMLLFKILFLINTPVMIRSCQDFLFFFPPPTEACGTSLQVLIGLEIRKNQNSCVAVLFSESCRGFPPF